MTSQDEFNLTTDNRPVKPDKNQDSQAADGAIGMGGSGAGGTDNTNYPNRSADSGLNQALRRQQEQDPAPTTGSDYYTARGTSIGGYDADTGAGDTYASPTTIASGANGNSTASGNLEDGSGGHQFGDTEADYQGRGTSDSGEIVGGG